MSTELDKWEPNANPIRPYSCEHKTHGKERCPEPCSHRIPLDDWPYGKWDTPRCLCETHYKALVERENPVTIGTLWARIKARYLR